MPDINSLMQTWPREFDEMLANGYPSFPDSLETMVDLMCGLLDIPVYNMNRIQSLHVLFSLYSSSRNSSLSLK